ncbi:SusC/RagA family TonB-linked outer membrane protein [Chitinophaga pollutisoli]|uniref:SusC/RagA family TonB-linked outer membrane protein n=1 Tax=Chitinophaga pollutisoli TaxID=3133966 RepID=A0ABZ2YTA0_9BACT
MKTSTLPPRAFRVVLQNRFSKAFWLAVPIVLLACMQALAQSRNITGSVKDDSGVSLAGVTIQIKGTTTGTVSDADGKFKLTVPNDNALLNVSFIGYEQQEIPVAGKSDINIVLLLSKKTLTDVVVVGYGTVAKRNLTSAVTTVTSKDFVQGGFNSPLQQIDGKIAGVTVSNVAVSDPNRGADVQVRGAGSLGAGTSPLIVIDGMPNGDLRNIMQQDIASYTVLKDAAAAAIYGSRGANGVILIETKKGKSGKVTLTYDSYLEHDAVAAKPDILTADEYLERSRGTDQGARTNWYDELLNTGNIGTNQFLTVSGGNENTVFRLSGNYRTKEGIDIASDRKEYGYRANFQQKAIDGRLEFSGNVSQRFVKEEYTNYGAFNQAAKLNPTIPIMDPDEPTKYNFLAGYDTYNPVADLLTRENGADVNYSIVDLNAKFHILKNFSTELKLARQGQDKLRREYYNSKAPESISNNRTGRARLQTEKWTDYTLEWLGNYNTSIGKHDISAMGGYSYQEFNYQQFNAENMNFPSDAFGYNNLGAGLWNLEAGRLGMGSGKEKEQLIAFLGRVNYNFDDTYFLTASLRYEGSSKFGRDNKWGMFPAVSAAWRIANLPALKDSRVIDDLKLRASYGVTGRSGFARYSALFRYTGYGKYQNDQGQWITVYGPGNNYNPNLAWERAIAYNIGLDFALFNNRLSGNLDVFDRRSKDILGNYDVPVGAYPHDQMFVNVGTTSSKGIELALNWEAVKTNDFSYTTNITTSYIKTKLITFSNEEFKGTHRYLQDLPSPGNPGPAYRLDPGTEIGSFYGYKYAGVNDDGQIMVWKDGQVGKEAISFQQANANRDRTYIGHGAPRYELSWGNSLAYKSFDLSLYFRGRFDYQILNLYQMYYGLQAEQGINLLKDAYTRNGHIKSSKLITDYFLEDGDYFRLENITLGWSPKLQSKLVSNLRLYGSVRNVFTTTKYSGLDPTSIGVTGLTPGYGDLSLYPVTRSFTFGAQVSF